MSFLFECYLDVCASMSVYIYTDMIFPESYAPKTHFFKNIQQLQCTDRSAKTRWLRHGLR